MKTLKKLTSVLLASTLTFSVFSLAYPYETIAKGSVSRSSGSSKSTSSKPSSNSSKPSSSGTSSKPSSSKSNSSSNFKNNKSGSYNSSYNSYNNSGYKKTYTDYLNNNYRNSGFFSGNTITNALLWYTLFNVGSHHNVQASDKEKELVDNVKDSKVPVYMLEIKTTSGETKHVTVTKEQYEKVKEGDNISLKDGNLEIK